MTHGRPTAAPAMSRNSKGALCYPDHSSMAVVMAGECSECGADDVSPKSKTGLCPSCNGKRNVQYFKRTRFYERERRSARG